MAFRNYDPNRIIMVFRGSQISGFMDGTFVSAERAEDAFSKEVGANGDVTRVRNRDRTGMVTITLQGASPSNDVLSAAAATDEITGLGYGSLMLKDLNGNTLASAAIAWIRKLPTVEYSKDSNGGREWVFDCSSLEMNVGGNVI